jgi:hypothetical protein
VRTIASLSLADVLFEIWGFLFWLITKKQGFGNAVYHSYIFKVGALDQDEPINISSA